MVRYAENELLSITDFTKQLNKVMKSIKNHTLEKVGVLKNNKLEAVIISTEEYNRLKEIEELLLEEVEHKEIYNLIEERKNTPTDDYISLEALANKFDVDMKTL